MKTGIELGNTLPGLMSEFRVMSAARHMGYQYFGNWQDLGWREKSLLVAYYLADIMIGNHSEDARARAVDRGKKNPKKG